MLKENYCCAILIAYRMYCKFINDIEFNEFEKIVSNDDYNYFLQKIYK